MLSKREREYRCKIIAENHLKKDEQKYLDFYVAENKIHSTNLTYKYLYLNYGLFYSSLINYRLSKLSYAMESMRTSCERAAIAFKTLSDAVWCGDLIDDDDKDSDWEDGFYND